MCFRVYNCVHAPVGPSLLTIIERVNSSITSTVNHGEQSCAFEHEIVGGSAGMFDRAPDCILLIIVMSAARIVRLHKRNHIFN